MSSQEVVDFVQSKITEKDENDKLRPLSSIVEEVSLQMEGAGGWDRCVRAEMRHLPANTCPSALSGISEGILSS